MNISTRIKKMIAGLLLVSLILSQTTAPIFAEEAPNAPVAPTAPAAPEAPSAPSTPLAPTENQPTAPVAPTAPDPYIPPSLEAPKAPVAPTAPTAPESPNENSNQSLQPVGSESNNAPVQNGTSSSGNVGDTAVATGDASSDGNIVTNANSNLSTTPTGNGSSASVSNTGNGANSTNNGSASVTNNNSTDQNNSAVVNNNMDQSAVTGRNDTSYNVGDSSIQTGDANTTGTVITSVNTNVDGVAVAEFNIADDHVGDIVLDFNAGCIQGCGGTSISTDNSNNGAGSNNTSSTDSTTNNTTNQANDAAVNTTMTLGADSGNNDASFNTGGDSVISTGDANVSASAVTFANNNIAGDVIYAVVNIFGDLVGDIILTEEMMNAVCGGTCGGQIASENSGNGAGSTNTANASTSTSDITNQTNNADINNTLVLDTETGNNDASFNTDGSSAIITGDTKVEANVLNIANTNVSGGNMWLVIVNEAGKWIGKLFGAPEGSNMAGSTGVEFEVDPTTGAVTAGNSGNGANSTNTANASQDSSTTTNQTNNATINNTLNLSANTGGNSSSFNTGGNSGIITGDATIVANIVNFVNNNITGGGKLFVTVVNVFGSWAGDFLTPGSQKETAQLQQPQEIGGTSNHEQNTTPVPNSNSSQQNTSNPTVTPTQVQPTIVRQNDAYIAYSPSNSSNTPPFGSIGASISVQITPENPEVLGTNDTQVESAVSTKKKITINLAWLLLGIPAGLMYVAIRKRRLFIKPSEAAI